MNCIIYLPHSYAGKGPAESCVQIVKYFKELNIEVELFVGREKRNLPKGILVSRALPRFLNWIPWRLVSKFAIRRLDKAFAERLRSSSTGIAYFWPPSDIGMVSIARENGWMTVREMTNRTLASAKISLDQAFKNFGESRPHHIDDEKVHCETQVLRQFDFVFSSNDHVDHSLRSLGLSEDRILQTTFGWNEGRFSVDKNRDQMREFTVGYLGTISIGKGVLDLLEAWTAWNGAGRLRLAGPIDWSMEQPIRDAIASDTRIEVVGYVADIQSFLEGCDAVVIPTLDEGGPQVTYEVAAAGIPIIATPMATARMLVNGESAMIVPTHDPQSILECLEILANDTKLAKKLGKSAQSDARNFTYSKVAGRRAELLKDAYKNWKKHKNPDHPHDARA